MVADQPPLAKALQELDIWMSELRFAHDIILMDSPSAFLEANVAYVCTWSSDVLRTILPTELGDDFAYGNYLKYWLNIQNVVQVSKN